ncbi:protein Ycf2-like isoform X2 [Cheilinus undulatus]|uniref:protein Ycf2-like isoform X2 n=1 Tax=Cheilinus undulatus TaxID=241271 RepID=UPI001BD67C16|nr:protein Ycf2-like isoform X2 [Cheilinus undulatus]
MKSGGRENQRRNVEKTKRIREKKTAVEGVEEEAQGEEMTLAPKQKLSLTEREEGVGRGGDVGDEEGQKKEDVGKEMKIGEAVKGAEEEAQGEEMTLAPKQKLSLMEREEGVGRGGDVGDEEGQKKEDVGKEMKIEEAVEGAEEEAQGEEMTLAPLNQKLSLMEREEGVRRGEDARNVEKNGEEADPMVDPVVGGMVVLVGVVVIDKYMMRKSLHHNHDSMMMNKSKSNKLI